MLSATAAFTTGTGLETVNETLCESLLGLLSGGVWAPTLAVLEITVPSGTLQRTFATLVNAAETPFARLVAWHLIRPDWPTGGRVQFQPAGGVSDTNPVPDTSVSGTVIFPAFAGPLFVTVTV